MIVSASRRTDIPAYYSEWMMNRLREGYVLVRNPMNARQVSRVSLSPDVVDGIVFWTKNPAPMVKLLPGLEPWHYYFHVTVTPYGRGAEAGLPSKDQVIIPPFRSFRGGSAANGRCGGMIPFFSAGGTRRSIISGPLRPWPDGWGSIRSYARSASWIITGIQRKT